MPDLCFISFDQTLFFMRLFYCWTCSSPYCISQMIDFVRYCVFLFVLVHLWIAMYTASFRSCPSGPHSALCDVLLIQIREKFSFHYPSYRCLVILVPRARNTVSTCSFVSRYRANVIHWRSAIVLGSLRKCGLTLPSARIRARLVSSYSLDAPLRRKKVEIS